MKFKIEIDISFKRIILILIYLAVFFAPIGATGVSLHTPIGEISLFRLFLFFATFIAFLDCFFSGRKIVLCNKNTRYSVMFFCVWIIYALVTVLWVRDIKNYFKIMFFLITGFLCIVLISNYCGTTELDNILKILNLGILLQCALGYYEFWSGNYLYLKQESVDIYFSHNIHYPVAMMGNPNDFSTGMFLGIVASLYLYYIKDNQTKKKLFYLICIAAYVVAIALSDSKACLGGAIAFLGFFLYKKKNYKSKILTIALVLAVLMVPSVNTYIFSKVDLTYFRAKGESFSNRVNLIRNGLDFLIKTYGFGVGNGQIEYWMQNSARYNTGNILNMHNWWMEILTGYGLIIFSGFMVFFVNLYTCFITRYKSNKKTIYGKQMLVFSASLIGLILTLVSSSSNMTKEYVWLFWAILIAYQKQDENSLLVEELS